MALDPSFTGRVYPPLAVYEVGREKIREFADAIGDPNPVYRDPAAAQDYGHRDVLAPPTFPIIITWPAATRIIEDVSTRGGHGFLTTRTDVATVEGEHVVSGFSKLVVRGDEGEV